jgi:hypothetical protein
MKACMRMLLPCRWAEREPSYMLMLPFHHFYDAHHFEAFARDYGAPIRSCDPLQGTCRTELWGVKSPPAHAGVEIVWELPPERVQACMLQQQLSEQSPQAINRDTHRCRPSRHTPWQRLQRNLLRMPHGGSGRSTERLTSE